MKKRIDEYLKDHELAWGENTRRSERHRMGRLGALLVLDPKAAWDQLQDLGSYSRITYWVRLTHFYDWLLSKGYRWGANPYREFRKRNKRLFKNVYEPRVPETSYLEARKLVEGIEDGAVRAACLELLDGALRHVDYARRQGDHTRGKGGKLRRVYGEQKTQERVRYQRLYRSLRSAGLRPHDLRKIRLNQAVDAGMEPFMLKDFAGWESIETAQSYIKRRENKVEEFLAGVDGGGSVVAQK